MINRQKPSPHSTPGIVPARLSPQLVSALLAMALMAVAGQPLLAQPLREKPGDYMGRTIANVMSYRGATWLERESRPSEEDTDLLFELLPIEEGQVVVDLGCGSGYFARRMAKPVGKSGRVLCVDIQPQMLEIARQLAERDGIDNMTTILSEEDDPKLPAGEVDLILLVDVYHEMSKPEPMLEKMRLALSPGGVIALVEFRLEGTTASHIKLDHRMSVEQVEREWLPAGFELIRLEQSLPTQHLFLFRAARTGDGQSD
jgi:predicted O-methyltransferase YrrM